MKVLITGGSGLLGQYINIILSKNNEILTLYNSNEGNCNEFNSVKIDVTNYSDLEDIFTSFEPNVVVHTAAISRPEICDKLPNDIVTDININSTKYLAKLSDMKDVKLIFTSTDLIYDGNQGQMLLEDAKINPVSLYAETKFIAENEIKNIFGNYIILRTSLLYGLGLNHSTNSFHNMYLNFCQNKISKLFYDQFRTPLSLIDAARLIDSLLNLNVKEITLNFGGSERVSRVELGEILCKVGNFDKSLIERISMNDIPDLHKVPDVSMNTDKLQSLGLKQKSVEESVYEIINSKWNGQWS